jgi:hypothetical protein
VRFRLPRNLKKLRSRSTEEGMPAWKSASRVLCPGRVTMSETRQLTPSKRFQRSALAWNMISAMATV